MNGKWHVHSGDAKKPTRSSDLESKELALTLARTLREHPEGPPFRFISRPDSTIMSELEVKRWCAENPE